jgi:hypothetical protein
MTVDENTDTGDPVQSVHLWIDQTKIDPIAPAAWGRVGKHRQPKSSPTSTGYPTLRVTDSTQTEIDHCPRCHQWDADTTQQSTRTDTFASSRQEQDLSVQLEHLTASNARPRASSESFLSSSSNTSRHDRVVIDAIVTTTFQGDLCRMSPAPSTPATTDCRSIRASIAFTSFPAMALTTPKVVIKHPRTLSVAFALRLQSKTGRSGSQEDKKVLFRTYSGAHFHANMASHQNKVSRITLRPFESRRCL